MLDVPGLNADAHSMDSNNVPQAIWLIPDTGLVRLSVIGAERPVLVDSVEKLLSKQELGSPFACVSSLTEVHTVMGQAGNQDRLFYSFNLDEHVPRDHLLRGINWFLDLGGLRQHLAPFYSHTGRPSIDPELMVRMLWSWVTASALVRAQAV
jgi:hypothetical protein